MINKPTNGGFTLIEMMVAVLLLTLSIGGPLTISSKGLTVALVAKDQTTAFYLAQDAVEYVRYARDTNTLRNGDWLTGAGGSGATINLGPCVSETGNAACRLDSLASQPAAPESCTGGCGVLRRTSSNAYNYSSSGVATIYTRSISIKNPNDGAVNEAVLTVTVSWSDIAGSTRTISVTEDLFNWQ